MKVMFTSEEMAEALKKERVCIRIDTELRIMALMEQLNKDDKITSSELFLKVLFNVLGKSVNKLKNDLEVINKKI